MGGPGDLRPADRSAATLELELPSTVGTPSKATRLVALVRDKAEADVSNPFATVEPGPQTGEMFLRVDALAPGEIRVYVS